MQYRAKIESVRAIGADHVVDYTIDDFADGTHRYDVILDIGGNRRLAHLRRALTPRGRLVIVGGETDGRWLGGSDRQVWALLLSPFVGQKLGTFVASENAEDLTVLRELIEAGKIAPAIDRAYPLGEAAAAIRASRPSVDARAARVAGRVTRRGACCPRPPECRVSHSRRAGRVLAPTEPMRSRV